MKLILDYQTIELQEFGLTLDMKILDEVSYQRVVSFLAKSQPSNSLADTDDMESLSAFGLKQLSSDELMKIGKEVIPEFCCNLKGLLVKDQGVEREGTLDDLLKTGAGVQVALSILMRLFSISGLTADEVTDLKKG